MHATHVVAKIGTVPHRMVDALVGEEASHEHILNADIAEQIIEVGGVEDGRGGLGQHQLTVLRREFFNDTRLP